MDSKVTGVAGGVELVVAATTLDERDVDAGVAAAVGSG
jgi:hypothetical protein